MEVAQPQGYTQPILPLHLMTPEKNKKSTCTAAKEETQPQYFQKERFFCVCVWLLTGNVWKVLAHSIVKMTFTPDYQG